MHKRSHGGLVLALLLLPTAFLTVIAGPETDGDKMTIDRVMDKVALTGDKLPAAKGKPIAGLRLLAFHGGKAVPIPFQVDERNAAGAYVMTRPDGSVDQDEDHGLMDDNDELTFMAMDLGDRGDPEALHPGCPSQEIELRDPQSHAAGWAYLVSFADSPPPLSPVRYMSYAGKKDLDEVSSPYYALHFPKNNVFISDFMISPKAGGNGVDIMDRIKMRSGVDVLAGSVSIVRTEEDFVTEVLGMIVGPVRVIRQTSTRINLALSVKSPSVLVDGSFYPCSFEFPSMLSMPFRMDMIATDAYIRQGWDLNRNAAGMTFHTNLNPEGVTMDGKMSEAEKELAGNRTTLFWALGTGKQGTFMFRGVWDNDAPFRALLYYEDDWSRLEPPEDDPGVMGFAYQLEDVLKMGSDEYGFNIENYVVPNYDGNQERALRVYYNPLEAKVTP